jgi:molybdopterin-binding protein
MNTTHISAILFRFGTCLALAFALRLAADVVVTSNGARIVGKITDIRDGTITIATDYAGEIKVKQGLVTSIETDRPVAVRLTSGDRVTGIVSEAAAGKLKIAGGNGDSYATMDQIAASWAAGEEDPAIVAQRRKWSYQAGVDINGESGTRNQLGTNVIFRATLKGPDDALLFYTAYNRQVTDGEKSADQFKAGVDYGDNFSQATSWYVRDEAGFDRVKEITFDDMAAAGLGYDFIKAKDVTLTGRAGLSYRKYEYSAAADTAALSAVGGDAELQYMQKIGKAQLSDRIAYLPDFQDTANYIITHELAYEIPITRSLWKLAIGVSNSYDSKPVDDVKRLDTLYFTRLELTWERR